MSITPDEDRAVLEAVSRASGPHREWTDVVDAMRSRLAPQSVGPWRISAKQRGLIETHPHLMNIARITIAGQQAVREGNVRL